MVMGFPKKSVSGLAVVEMAEFGRTVVYENRKPGRSIEFGSIYHMGVVENTREKMDLDLLASPALVSRMRHISFWNRCCVIMSS